MQEDSKSAVCKYLNNFKEALPLPHQRKNWSVYLLALENKWVTGYLTGNHHLKNNNNKIPEFVLRNSKTVTQVGLDLEPQLSPKCPQLSKAVVK